MRGGGDTNSDSRAFKTKPTSHMNRKTIAIVPIRPLLNITRTDVSYKVILIYNPNGISIEELMRIVPHFGPSNVTKFIR